MKLASCLAALFLLCGPLLSASESASDCESAVETLRAGIESNPERFLDLFLDALRTNPGCRRNLFREAVFARKDDPAAVEKVIFIARQEFPGDDTSFAEAALATAPELAGTIRDAFFAEPARMKAALEPESAEKPSQLVQLPEEALELDSDIREAIARTTARLEGKLWPEQEVSADPVAFRTPDRIRTSGTEAIETSLENGMFVDDLDERIVGNAPALIRDRPERNEEIRLDESKLTAREEDSREMREARRREIAPAGEVTVPQPPRVGRSAVGFSVPAEPSYHSTIDRDDRPRPPLVIHSAPLRPTMPR